MRAWQCFLMIITSMAFTVGAASASSYGGRWTANASRTAHCLSFYADIIVLNNQIAIGISGAGVYTLRGTVAPNSKFDAVSPNDTVNASGKFTGDKVELTLRAPCGLRIGSGQRAR